MPFTKKLLGIRILPLEESIRALAEMDCRTGEDA